MNKLYFEGEFVHYELRNGVLIYTYRSGVRLNLEIAKEIVIERLKFSDNKNYPMLVKDMGMTSMDKEARDYFSSSEGIVGVSAGGILVDSVFNTFLGNFFLRVSRPKLPTRIFTDESEALEWLKQFI